LGTNDLLVNDFIPCHTHNGLHLLLLILLQGSEAHHGLRLFNSNLRLICLLDPHLGLRRLELH
jgi:hypothetical protein